MGRTLAFLAALALLGAAAAAPAQSGGVQVSPVVIEMAPERGLTSLRVRNGRERETSFEMLAYAWSQAEGENALSPTRALIIAPSVFAIGANDEQIVRVALASEARQTLQNGREQTYRLVLRELPPPEPLPESFRGGSRMVLEMSMPVFVTPQGLTPQLYARRIEQDGQPALLIGNRGGAHARLGDVQSLPSGEHLADAPRYLLAGAEFITSLPHTAHSVRLRRATSRQPVPIEETFALAAQR
ncbi:MAG: molecular chaperone, partial [Hyphomonadaceae bacterium]